MTHVLAIANSDILLSLSHNQSKTKIKGLDSILFDGAKLLFCSVYISLYEDVCFAIIIHDITELFRLFLLLVLIDVRIALRKIVN